MSDNQSTANAAGFAVLYAVTVIAVISSLGVVLADILVRQSSLTATSRESTRAFYAADTGIECALFWDQNQDHFSRDGSGVGDIECANQSGINVSDSGTTYSFSLDSDNGGNSAVACADVSVEKATTSSGVPFTRIESLGRDTCSGSDQIERAIRTQY